MHKIDHMSASAIAPGSVTFAFQAAPTTDSEKSDLSLYREVIEECELGAELGFEAAWFLEHHFSDYYPTPSPLLFMSHIAARCPTLGLGTAVLVLPWYHPVRIAEEIAMVNSLTEGTLHLGMGRGTAKSEYDGYGIDMNGARQRYAECWRIINMAMRGKPFTFEGEHYSVNREVAVRPDPTVKPVNFYGAIGSLGSATLMADLGLPPLCLAQFPDHLLERILAEWKARAAENANGENANGENAGVEDGILAAPRPLSIKCYIADTDEEARRIGRRYLAQNFDIQARHYEVDANPWQNIPEYEVFSKMFANMKAMADPDNLDPLMDLNLVGSPDTIAARIETLRGLGFDYFIVASALPGTPLEVRRRMYTMFAEEVTPRFDAAFSASPQQPDRVAIQPA